MVLGVADALPAGLPPAERMARCDRWLLSRHEACRAEVDQALDGYRFSEAAQALYRFIWSELCDWGIEAAKPRLYGGSAEEQADAASVLAWVLERSLRLLHPMMPFVTEELWQRLGDGGSIVVAPWPRPHPEHRDERAESDFGFAMELVTTVRRFRKSHALRDAMPLAAGVAGTVGQVDTISALRPEIERLAGLSTLSVLDGSPEGAGSARLAVAGAQVFVPLAGILDVERERQRLSKRLADVAADVARVEGKLADKAFVSKAPVPVVEKERAKLASLRDE